MRSSEIKLDFFRKIDSLRGEKLREAYGILVNYLNSHEIDHWSELSEDEKASIEKGLSQIDKGMGKPHSEVMAKFIKKYSK